MDNPETLDLTIEKLFSADGIDPKLATLLNAQVRFFLVDIGRSPVEPTREIDRLALFVLRQAALSYPESLRDEEFRQMKRKVAKLILPDSKSAKSASTLAGVIINNIVGLSEGTCPILRPPAKRYPDLKTRRK